MNVPASYSVVNDNPLCLPYTPERHFMVYKLSYHVILDQRPFDRLLTVSDVNNQMFHVLNVTVLERDVNLQMECSGAGHTHI